MIRNRSPDRLPLTWTYAQAVFRRGGYSRDFAAGVDGFGQFPSRPQNTSLISSHRFDAFILSGGDDPKTEPFGAPTHAAITPVLDARQTFETQLIHALANSPQTPVLGILPGHANARSVSRRQAQSASPRHPPDARNPLGACPHDQITR